MNAKEKGIVSLLEEHVEFVISTVQQLRTAKLQLEAKIARLNSDLLQRDPEIQDLEDRNSDFREKLDAERIAISEEHSEIRERLEASMDVLIASDEDREVEINFEVAPDESDAETVEAEESVGPRGFAGI